MENVSFSLSLLSIEDVIYDISGGVFWHLPKGIGLHDFSGQYVCKDGSVWITDGQLHWIDGPAIVRNTGSQEWWFNNMPHRDDGPAKISPKGDYVGWFIRGEDITHKVFLWQKSIDIPHWSLWTNTEKTLFRLKFL